ncbi:MAG: transcription-repair coupling factor [Lachnospiraceae bacterium]|nr:transcription-repair coupling factor [Lachnospiraceae bacterium]
MRTFDAPFSLLAEYETLKTHLKKGRGIIAADGCVDPQKLHMMYGLSDDFDLKIIVTFSETKARQIFEDYRFYDPDVCLFPAKDLIFFQADLSGNVITEQRMRCIRALLERKRCTIVTTADAFMAHMVPISSIEDSIIYIDEGGTVSESELAKELVNAGYVRNFQIEGKGQFSIRGGIIDIYPLTDDNPVRIELWGDTVDSIRTFDVLSQRSIEKKTTVAIYPASEMVLDEQRLAEGISKITKEAKEVHELYRKSFRTQEAANALKIATDLKEELEISGQSGINPDSFIEYFYDDTQNFADYFSKKSCVFFLDEPVRLRDSASAVELEFSESMKMRLEKGYVLPTQTKVIYTADEVFARFENACGVAMSTLTLPSEVLRSAAAVNVITKAMNSYNNSFESLISDLKRFSKNSYKVVLLSASRTRAARLAEDLRDGGINAFYTENTDREVAAGEVMVTYGRLRQGFEYPLIKFAVISEADIFTQRHRGKKRKTKFDGNHISSFTELTPGDYVVHVSHGLGIYRGIEQVSVSGVTKDYMKISYRDGGNLYIPATALDTIQKYASKDAHTPKLNKLGGQEWGKTKSRVREAVDVIAQDLVELYAARSSRRGYEYGPDTVWQTEFEELFPFEETEDQMTAIEDTKRDMESSKIMDRLICGDVGYGKTEIAIRAAFKAVQEGKQVVYLVPTTVLAQQHYTTFVQRMKDYPVRIELLCRFRSASEIRKTVRDLANGMVDIVIGTHRVLSKDVTFKDLGLLIIDEEQRFGVSHKEKIKKLKENVDVLTLTATPIPRTLHMSLIGIRDMSVLEEAPQDRVPIQTFVMEYNEELVREAISRELARGGQIFYVYNRVQTIADMTAQLSRLLPDARISFAHGQMKETDLERIMYDFVSGDIDVLVSTTIIETGLDIPNVNTMIIHDADQMGLSQLYQLRGRIGRSNRTAYAFLMYRRNKILRETAEKRLQAIRDFTELGSGFKIAMQDLEIRGAGNLLGERQSGHMNAVGYDMYCKLLNEAVRRKKGEEVREEDLVNVDLDIDAYIPDTYIVSENQKIDVYKRIACISSKEEMDDMKDELTDRFGSIPKPVDNLLLVAYLRTIARQVFVTEIVQKENSIEFRVLQNADYDPVRIAPFVAGYKGKLRLATGAKPCFIYRFSPDRVTGLSPASDSLQISLKMCEDMKSLVDTHV